MEAQLTKLQRKRKMRRLRLNERRLKNRMKALWGDICELIEAEMPDGYSVRYNWDTQGLPVENMGWLDKLAEAQYRNASHWLNDGGIFA